MTTEAIPSATTTMPTEARILSAVRHAQGAADHMHAGAPAHVLRDAPNVHARTVPGRRRPMRRADREVLRPTEIADILQACSVVHVAYADAQGLTIVPVDFAYSYEPAQTDELDQTNASRDFGSLRLVMHSALEGRKIDAIRAHGNALPVAFEMECNRTLFEGSTPRAATTAYRSIIGTGVARLIDDVDEKIRSLVMQLDQRSGVDDRALAERHEPIIAVWEVVASEFTAKHHPAA